MNKIAAAYLRRSSVSSDNPGDDSRDAQEAAVRRLCGQDVVLFVDWGISGSRTDRPDYQRLRAAIKAGEVASVCAYSLSRLGRNARELLDFVELCQKNDVPVRTTVESIDTSTAMGRAMLGVMAVFAQLELEQGRERSAAAREAREARYSAAGLELPASRPLFGTRHVMADDGLLRIETDEPRLAPVLYAYEATGYNVRATAAALTGAIPAPEGGRTWGISTLRRILIEHAAFVPTINAAGRNRPATNVKAPYAGLLLCHCGRTVTPNTVRHQYYCAAGLARGVADHGRYIVTERALRAVLDPVAMTALDETSAELVSKSTGEGDAARRRLEAKLQRLNVKLDAETITEAEFRRQAAAIKAELARLERSDQAVRTVLQTRITQDRPDPAGDPAAYNAHLRTLWASVQLGPDMLPARRADGAVLETGPDDAPAGVNWLIPLVMHDQATHDEWVATA